MSEKKASFCGIIAAIIAVPLILGFVITGIEKLSAEPIIDEKSSLLNTVFFGDYTNARKIKKSGKITLEIWEPYLKHSENIIARGIFSRNTMLGPGPSTLDVQYDEIWILKNDKGFTPAEKSKWQGRFDITKLYWQNNKVKAATVEKYYLTNPITGKKVGKHKLVMIWDRDNVLKELAK